MSVCLGYVCNLLSKIGPFVVHFCNDVQRPRRTAVVVRTNGEGSRRHCRRDEGHACQNSPYGCP